MSLSNDFDDTSAWGNVAQTAPGDILRDAMKKEAIIKYVFACDSIEISFLCLEILYLAKRTCEVYDFLE